MVSQPTASWSVIALFPLVILAGGVAAALAGLLVAIPAMFGYNYLVTTLRGMIVELDNFAAELASAAAIYGERGDVA